jgi:hypothetical protein
MSATANSKSAEPEVHSRENSWFDGTKWIPVEKMSNSHLRKAKMFAQKREEQYFKKMCQYSEMVEMLDKEGERRGIKLKDFPSQFQKNNRTLKDAM